MDNVINIFKNKKQVNNKYSNYLEKLDKLELLEEFVKLSEYIQLMNLSINHIIDGRILCNLLIIRSETEELKSTCKYMIEYLNRYEESLKND